MKAIIIYSGKGGVGKTTTTANIARLLAKQGNKVFIIDADINTPSRVGRVVNHFQNDDNAYFMVINAPNTEVHLITGEIGICSLLTGQRGHFELPRVSYQTSKGNVVLFPDEIMPVDINLLQQEINEGYIMLSDGRYLPPKETVQQCYNAFGIRVGLGDNWEDIYDSWNKEMK